MSKECLNSTVHEKAADAMICPLCALLYIRILKAYVYSERSFFSVLEMAWPRDFNKY